MKALVLFRSFFGNTEHVADAIAQEMRTMGHETTVHDVRQKLPNLHGIDIAFIGSPTRMARANRKCMNVLKRLRKKGFSGTPLAVFDTYGPVPETQEESDKAKKWLYPGAAGIMQKAAKKQGLNVYTETLRCEVKGAKGPLADNEIEKAASFTRSFVNDFGNT
jgi:flavodoxin